MSKSDYVGLLRSLASRFVDGVDAFLAAIVEVR